MQSRLVRNYLIPRAAERDPGAKAVVKSWNELMAVITSKSAALKKGIAS